MNNVRGRGHRFFDNGTKALVLKSDDGGTGSKSVQNSLTSFLGYHINIYSYFFTFADPRLRFKRFYLMANDLPPLTKPFKFRAVSSSSRR